MESCVASSNMPSPHRPIHHTPPPPAYPSTPIKVNLAEEDVPTVASAIKYFFSQLAEPLFTADLYAQFLDAGRESCAETK